VVKRYLFSHRLQRLSVFSQWRCIKYHNDWYTDYRGDCGIFRPLLQTTIKMSSTSLWRRTRKVIL